MEDIIKSLVKKEYSNLGTIILNEQIENNDLLNLAYVFYRMHIMKYLNDSQIFIFFYLIKDRLIDVGDFETDVLDPSSKYTSKFLQIKKDLWKTNCGIDEVISKLNNSDGNKKFSGLTRDTFYKYITGELNELVRSFAHNRFTNLLMLGDTQDKNWLVIHENQIRERLQLVVKTFGIKLLKFLDIPIITNDVFYSFSFNDKVDYYKKCVTKMISAINTLKDMANRQQHLFQMENDMVNDYNHIINPVELDDSDDEHITGFDNIDGLLNDLVEKYFN